MWVNVNIKRSDWLIFKGRPHLLERYAASWISTFSHWTRLLAICRLIQPRLKPAPRRGSNLSTTMKRTFGRRKKSNLRRTPSRVTGETRGRTETWCNSSHAHPTHLTTSWCSRFGGSQSSQSQAASQASERTAAPGTDTAAGKADCFSEEGDDSKDFDPFLSLGESDATKCEQEPSVALVMTKAAVKMPSKAEFACARCFFSIFFLLRLWLGGQLWRGELQGSCGRGGLLGLGESWLPTSRHWGGGERLGQVHRLPAVLLVSLYNGDQGSATFGSQTAIQSRFPL